MTPLAGQVAVVTGASRGVGEATARLLAQEGATVVRLARTLADGEDGPFFNLTTDLTDFVLLKRAMDEVMAEFGPPHIVVNNAGGFLLRLFEETTEEDLLEQLDINLVAPFNVARALRDAQEGDSAGQGFHRGER